MEVFILDTNLFFNMEAGLGLGDRTEDVVIGLTDRIGRLRKNGKAAFCMSPRTVEEFLGFFDNREQPFIKSFLSSVNIESPDISKIATPATVLYRLIEDIRERSYRGLNIAEEEISNAVRELGSKDLGDKKEFQIKTGAFIRKFRERYRNATRTGFIDSLADLDLIMLAKQKDGFIVSTDQGVLNWGRTFGVKEMPAAIFRQRLEDLLV